MDPLLLLRRCRTRAQRHLGWTPFLHGAHISLLKGKKKEGDKGEESLIKADSLAMFVLEGRTLRSVSGSPDLIQDPEMTQAIAEWSEIARLLYLSALRCTIICLRCTVPSISPTSPHGPLTRLQPQSASLAVNFHMVRTTVLRSMVMTGRL